jgi:hypothetical protein
MSWRFELDPFVVLVPTPRIASAHAKLTFLPCDGSSQARYFVGDHLAYAK